MKEEDNQKKKDMRGIKRQARRKRVNKKLKNGKGLLKKH
jgi:hypothetical protein